MFYLLNFENHKFISCDDALIVEDKIRELISGGCNKDSLEVVSGFDENARYSVDEFRSYLDELYVPNVYVDESKITDSARVSVTWDSYGIAVDFNYSYDEFEGYGESVLCFCEIYDDGCPDQKAWDEAQRIGRFLKEKYNLPLDISKDEWISNVLKFECNCKSEDEFAELMKGIHEGESGYNFEIAARLWYKPDGIEDAIMVELQVTTKDCRELVENDDEPDWLTAYKVKNECDYNCSGEIGMSESLEDVKFSDLKDTMLDFAKRVGNELIMAENKSLASKQSLTEQIKSADDNRVNTSRSSSGMKAIEAER